MNIYYSIIVAVYVFGFFYGRLLMIPLKEVINEHPNNKIAEKIQVRMPKPFVLVLFLKKRERVSIIAITYQIIWYILLVRAFFIILGTNQYSIERLAKIVVDPVIVNIALNGLVDYIIFKLDRRKK